MDAVEPVHQYAAATADAQLARIDRLLRSGTAAPVGHRLVAELEHVAAEHLGRAGAIAVSSATAGLELALRVLGVGTGREVVIPELGWVSIGASVAATGAAVRVAPVTTDLTATWQQIGPLLNGSTGAVVLAHLRGRAACDTLRIADQLRTRGIPLIEDCAQAWGVRLADGSPAGSAGTVSVFSTQAYKLIATGEGGIVATDDQALLTRARALGGDSRVRTATPLWRGNTRMNAMAAASALPQLAHLDEILSQLRPLQRHLTDRLHAAPGIQAVLPAADDADASNGSLVGIWTHDADQASLLAARLHHAGFHAWSPGPGDLHHAAAWPAGPGDPIVDVRRYLDVQIPLLPPDQHDAFCGRVVSVVTDWHTVVGGPTGRGTGP